LNIILKNIYIIFFCEVKIKLNTNLISMQINYYSYILFEKDFKKYIKIVLLNQRKREREKIEYT